MKSCLLFAIILLTGLNGSCQTDTSIVPVAAHWNIGDSWQYDVTKIKRTMQGRKVMQDDSIHYRAQFLVAGADSSAYTIHWSMANPFFQVFGLPATLVKKYPQYATTVVIYKTSITGAYTGIDNWQEIGLMLNDLIREEIAGKTADTSQQSLQIRNSLKAMASVYTTKRGIEQLVFKELIMFHFPLGKQYEIGQLYNYTEKIPVMKNSLPATGDGIIFIRRRDTQKQTCELVQRMKVLPDSANTMLKYYFTQLGMRKEAIDPAIASSVLNVSDNNIFDYLYNPGIPVKITVSRETVIDVLDDHVKQIDKTIIEKVP
jgi:hypothetical protein